MRGMLIPERLRDMMEKRGLSQSELGRRVGVSQATIYKLVTGVSYGSKHLHLIARALETTPAYLTGETDDPDEGAIPRQPEPPARIMMEVILPPEPALAQMFEALLSGIDRRAPMAEQALLLARRLPIGLSQLQDLRPGATRAQGRRQAREATAADLATPDPGPPR